MEIIIENVRCLGSDIKTSKKGNTYQVALFQKGIETIQLMLPDGSDVLEDAHYNLFCDYSTRWKQLTLKALVDIE